MLARNFGGSDQSRIRDLLRDRLGAPPPGGLDEFLLQARMVAGFADVPAQIESQCEQLLSARHLL
jgi:hypothetical protein